MAVGQLCFTLYSLVFFFLIWLNFVVVWLGFWFFVVVSVFCFFPEKLIVCLLDLIYYVHYSNTYVIQAESENRTLVLADLQICSESKPRSGECLGTGL